MGISAVIFTPLPIHYRTHNLAIIDYVFDSLVTLLWLTYESFQPAHKLLPYVPISQNQYL
jgi:hypothetical protein